MKKIKKRDHCESFFLKAVRAYWQKEDSELAEKFCRKIIARDSNHAGAYHILGKALKERVNATKAEVHEAILSLNRACQLSPNPLVLLDLAAACSEAGLYEDSEKFRLHALALDPGNLLLKLAASVGQPPSSPRSLESINVYISHLKEAIKSFTGIDLAEFSFRKYTSPYFKDVYLFAEEASPLLALNYYGISTAELKAEYGRIFKCSRQSQRIESVRSIPKIGFVATSAERGVFCKETSGIVNHWDYKKASLLIICSPFDLDFLKEYMPRARYLLVTQKPIEAIEAQSFDLLYFWNASIDYFLPYWRLAPVQVTSFGASDTTSPAIDYFISSELWETEDADKNYVEAQGLIKLKNIPSYYYRPEIKAGDQTKVQKTGKHVYSFPHMLWKLHPDFDEVLRCLLERDPAALIIIPGVMDSSGINFSRERLEKAMPEELRRRIEYTPRLAWESFLNILAQSDVILDPFYFSGCNVSREALAMGTPIITLPGQTMRSRYTYGFYKAMGGDFEECIATDPDDYVRKALRLAQDRELRENVRQRILDLNHVLFENLEAVKEFEDCLLKLIENARN